MLVDSHCHIQLPEFDEDREEALARAREAGVTAFVVVGTDVDSSCAALELADSQPDVYATLGLHPHDASRFDRRVLASLRRLADSSRAVAVGEIGLDYYRKLSPPDVQRSVFQKMLDLAGELRLPVVVHSREADKDSLETLSAWAREMMSIWPGDRPLGVMHSFGGDLTLALRYIELGFLISIPGTCTRPKSDRVSAVAAGIPLRSMVVETDSPFQSPQSHRGRRNEPAYLAEVVARIAELRGTGFDNVAAGTGLAAAGVFGLGDIGEEEFSRERGTS